MSATCNLNVNYSYTNNVSTLSKDYSYTNNVSNTYILTYLYSLTDSFSHSGHTQHIVVKYNLFIFRWGDRELYLRTILTPILGLWYSGHTAFKLVKRRCLFRMKRENIFHSIAPLYLKVSLR
jgi:hypothetical protein